MSDDISIVVYETKHTFSRIPQVRIIVVTEKGYPGKDMFSYEVHAVVLDRDPEMLCQYAFNGLSANPELTESIILTDVVLNEAVAIARRTLQELLDSSPLSQERKSNVSNEILSADWIMPSEETLTYSLSAFNEITLRRIFNNSTYKTLKTACQSAGFLRKEILRYRTLLHTLEPQI